MLDQEHLKTLRISDTLGTPQGSMEEKERGHYGAQRHVNTAAHGLGGSNDASVPQADAKAKSTRRRKWVVRKVQRKVLTEAGGVEGEGLGARYMKTASYNDREGGGSDRAFFGGRTKAVKTTQVIEFVDDHGVLTTVDAVTRTLI